jgi:deazaflavin-dependent oxidoreductase (nitroreductase family)
MTIQKPPAGTKGVRTPPRFMSRLMSPLVMRIHRLSGNKFGGMDLLYLSTTGARSGKRRTTPVVRFDGGEGRWLIVASAGGAATHPAWYHNIVAHPDQVWAEVGGTEHRVAVEQLDGEERERAWATVVRQAPRFDGYRGKTDRQMPVLRLTPTS